MSYEKANTNKRGNCYKILSDSCSEKTHFFQLATLNWNHSWIVSDIHSLEKYLMITFHVQGHFDTIPGLAELMVKWGIEAVTA